MAGQPSSRRRPTRSQTRAQVLDAAHEVFSKHGIAASSLNDIAAAAGLTKGAVYSSFASKDDLVLTIMEERLIERMHSATSAFDDIVDAGEAAHEAGVRLFRSIYADATWHRLLLEYCGLAMSDPQVHADLAQRRGKLRESVTRAIEATAEAREWTLPLPADKLAVTLLALANGLSFERDIDTEAVPDSLFGDVLSLLLGERPPP